MRSTTFLLIAIASVSASAGGLPPAAVVGSERNVNVLPVQNSYANTGVQVWVAVDDSELYEKGLPLDQAYAPVRTPLLMAASRPAHEYPPASQQLARGPLEPYERRAPSAEPATAISDEPPVYPGLPSVATQPYEKGEMVAMAPPSPYLQPLSPEAFMLMPVALHLDNATMDEVLANLVPSNYEVSYDVKPELRERRYNVALQTSLGQALADLSGNMGVRIIPYHKLQLLLVTDRKD